MPKVHEDGSISWSGIPTDAQVAKILEIPNDVIPPGMKDSVTDITEKMRLPGQSIIMDYNPAIGKSGRYSSNLSSGLRVAVPLGFHVSKAGNFYTTTLDVGAVQLKLKDWANSKTNKNLAMWDGDVRRFEQDMYKYLENHKADRSGETGLDANASTAEAKKNIINDFFGVAQKDANPITDARKATKRSGKARRVENLIRSRLFNRMNRIEKNRLTKYGAGTPLPMKTQADAYKKWKENYMPGDEVRYMPGGDVYARPLEVIKERIPASERFTGNKPPGKPVVRPDGKSFMEADLDTPIGKLDFTQDKIDDAFLDSISESGPAAQKAINELATPVTKINKDGVEEVVRPAFNMRPPDEAHWRDVENLPNRDRLWYEISAEAMDTSFPDHKQKQLGEVMDMTAATSPLADPNYNSRLMISIMSEIARDSPITTPAVVQKGVQDVVTGEFGKAEARKVGSFGQTFKFLRGLVDDPPLSTNDRQVAASFGIPDSAFGRYPVLYEVVARWFNKMRDNANTFRPNDQNGAFQSYQLQAPSWVQTRAEGQLARTKNLTDAEAFEGDAYASAFNRAADWLRDGGVKVGTDPRTGLPLFDMTVLKNPRVTEILAPLAGDFRGDVFGTMEIVTNLNKTGLEFNRLISESRNRGLNANLKLSDTIIRRHMNQLLRRSKRGNEKLPSVLTELARTFGEKSADVSRIELGWGTFEGAMNRNIRIPMGDVPAQYREAYLAVLGDAYQQAAQAASKFTDTNNPNPSTYTVFLKNEVDADTPALRQFAEDLSASGHEANIQLRPNGLVLDIHPKFTDDGSQVPIGKQVLQDMVDDVFPGNATKIRGQDYDSIYKMDSEYGTSVDKWKKVLENEAANDIQAITGGSRTEARALARGNEAALKELTVGKRRRVERVGVERRARLHQLELTKRKLRQSVKAFEDDILKFAPDLQKRINSHVRAEAKKQASIPKPKNLRPDFGRPDGRFMPAVPNSPTPTPSPTGQPVKLVMDKIYRLPEKDKEERKDRAKEILKKFIEQ